MASHGNTDTRRPLRARGVSAVPIVLMSTLALATLAAVSYVLWPRWPAEPTSPDAPALPIVIAGETFNVPPAAIRVAVQRRAGTQERIDLTFQWPSLSPPDPAVKAVGDRLFVTIAAAQSLPPDERLKSIYPRYTEGPTTGADGRSEVAFRDGSPYHGEDLVVEAAAPERFFARCSRRTTPRTGGICLVDRRLGGADVTLRFPRDWLTDWRSVAAGIDRLIETLRGPNTRR